MTEQQQTVADFQSAFAESVSFLDAPQAADVPQALLAVKATSNLLDTLLEIAKALGANLQQYLPQIKLAALAVYDSKIAPLNIPFVPDNVEPVVDGLLRSAIERGIDLLIAAQPTFATSQTAAVAKVAEIRAGLPA